MSIHSEEIPISSVAGFDRSTANGPLVASRNTVNAALMPAPRGTYTAQCQKAENPDFIALVVTRNVGPFSVTGLRPAVAALAAVFQDVQAAQPGVYAELGSDGMLCCRLVTGSATSISNHSWGTAIDLTIDGSLCPRGGGVVQRGLLDLWPIFNRHGFYWGIAFPTDDPMHFEASDQLIRKWAAAGEFGPQSGNTVPHALTIGDRGPDVLHLQQALNTALSPVTIDPDGVFGHQTRLAVIAFQRKASLPPDGTGTRAVRKALGVHEPVSPPAP